MEKIEFKNLINLKAGDYFVREYTHTYYRWYNGTSIRGLSDWYLHKVKRTFRKDQNYFEGVYCWYIGSGPSLDCVRVQMKPQSTNCLFESRQQYYHIPSQEEISPFVNILTTRAASRRAKAISDRLLKGYVKDFLTLDVTVPGLKLGERLILEKARHSVNTETGSIDLMLNTDLPYLGTDSLQLIEEAIQGLSEDKEWSLSYMVLVPRTYSKGGFPAAAFKLRVYLDLDSDKKFNYCF